jgi:Transmembrane secretion effector
MMAHSPGAGRRRSRASSTPSTSARTTTGVARKVLTISARRSSIASLLARVPCADREPAQGHEQSAAAPAGRHRAPYRHEHCQAAGAGAVLARPAYRRLFAAQTISRWGDTFNTVALVVLVFRLTGSGLGVTGAVIAEIAPVLLLAPLAGAVIDRLPQIRVMIAADLWRMALAGLLPLVDQHLLAVYAVAFGLAAGGVFFNPAASSVLPSIVDDEELVAANSGLWSAAVISQIALAPLAGALVAAVGWPRRSW